MDKHAQATAYAIPVDLLDTLADLLRAIHAFAGTYRALVPIRDLCSIGGGLIFDWHNETE